MKRLFKLAAIVLIVSILSACSGNMVTPYSVQQMQTVQASQKTETVHETATPNFDATGRAFATSVAITTFTPTATNTPTATSTTTSTATNTPAGTEISVYALGNVSIAGVTWGNTRNIGKDPTNGKFASVALYEGDAEHRYIISSSADGILYGPSNPLIKGTPLAAFDQCKIKTTGVSGITIAPCYLYSPLPGQTSFYAPGLVNTWQFFVSQVEGGPKMYVPFAGTATATVTPK